MTAWANTRLSPSQPPGILVPFPGFHPGYVRALLFSGYQLFLPHIQFMHPVSERMSVPGLFASVLEEEGHWRCSGGEPGLGQLIELQERNREMALVYRISTLPLASLS